MSRPQILVVEDEFLLAITLEEDLQRLGYYVIGPFATLQAALAGAAASDFDAAVLDVNLGGTMVYPLADQLVSRGVPIVFLSGYGFGVIPERFRMLPRLAKPSDAAAVDRELRRVLAA